MGEENKVKINSIFILQWNNEYNVDLQLHLKTVWAALVIRGIMFGKSEFLQERMYLSKCSVPNENGWNSQPRDETVPHKFFWQIQCKLA